MSDHKQGSLLGLIAVPALMFGAVFSLVLLGGSGADATCGPSGGETVTIDPGQVPDITIAGFGHEQLVNAAYVSDAGKALDLAARDRPPSTRDRRTYVCASHYARTMIREHALLPVRPGREADFEAAFAVAAPLVAATPGFVDLALTRSIESPSTYLLLITWESVEAHEVGFRQSDRYPQWRALLHDFYDPFPTVEHHVDVLTVAGPGAHPAVHGRAGEGPDAT